MRLALGMALLTIVIGVLDVASSNAVLQAGAGFEVNPLHRWTQEYMGRWWAVPKMLFHAIAAGMVVWFPNRAVLGAMAPVLVLTSLVVWHNYQLAV